MAELTGSPGFAPRSEKTHARKRAAAIQLIATVGLTISLVIAATAVSLGNRLLTRGEFIDRRIDAGAGRRIARSRGRVRSVGHLASAEGTAVRPRLARARSHDTLGHGDALDPHFRVGDLTFVDDDFVVEHDGAVAHRHVVVTAGRALAAALRVRSGREQEISGEHPRRCPVPLRRVPVHGEAIPARLRIQSPAEM